ncbi:MAG: hypothetical protein JXM70_20840, partial [Pirellulales bacterium]|nr:hypothetical protein [Pirellulales bacterium]
MDECFADPACYFRQCLSKMGSQRLLGINAIRANPNMVGYSATGTVDQGLTAEGFFTTFRDLKPGTIDAVFDGFYPLRWCTFVEPLNLYRGGKVRLEAVLANEDVLAAGKYPVRVQVFGPRGIRLLDREFTLTIPEMDDKNELSFAIPAFNEPLIVDGPAGKYRFSITFQSGAAAAGGVTEFFVDDPAQMPPVESTVTLWGQQDMMAKWLKDHAIRHRPFKPGKADTREVILVGKRPQEPGGAAALGELAERIGRGSTAVFLSPEVFGEGDKPTRWLPLQNKGTFAWLKSDLYIRDEWAKSHAIFAGLPAGGVLDLAFYREMIPSHGYIGLDPPDEAVCGGIKTSLGYQSGLFVSVHKLGAGRFILNAFPIQENLGRNPVAERLLRNMLRYASIGTDAPPVNLPANFQQQLKTRGY